MNTARTNKIRDLNDAFRTTLTGGRGFFIDEAAAMGDDFMAAALTAVRAFGNFNVDIRCQCRLLAFLTAQDAAACASG